MIPVVVTTRVSATAVAPRCELTVVASSLSYSAAVRFSPVHGCYLLVAYTLSSVGSLACEAVWSVIMARFWDVCARARRGGLDRVSDAALARLE